MSEQTPTVVLVRGGLRRVRELERRHRANVRDVIAAGPLFVAPSTRIELSVQAVLRPHCFGA